MQHLIIQRKMLHAIIVGQAYQMMLDIVPDHFTDVTLQGIYQAILACVSLGKPINRESVTDMIRQSGMKEAHKPIAIQTVGAICSREEIYTEDLPATMAEHYRKKVCRDLVESLSDANQTDAGMVEAVTKAAEKIIGGGGGSSMELMDITHEYFLSLDRGEFTDYKERSIIVHEPCLEKIFNKAIRPVCYVFCGQPGFRKTGIIMNVLVEAALRGKRCKYYSLEDNSKTCMAKFWATKYQLPWQDIANGEMESERLSELRKRIDLKKVPVIIDDKQYRIADLLMDMRRSCASQKLDLLAMDYIQAVSYNRFQEVAELNTLTKGMREISKQYQIPIIYTSQVNDRQEDKKTNEVVLTSAAAKGSGSILEDVRGYYLLMGNRDSDEKKIRCVKNPNGGGFSYVFRFDGPSGKMLEYRMDNEAD